MTGDLPNLRIPAPNIKNPELLTDSSGPGIYSAHPNIFFQDSAATRSADAPAIVFANSGREAREKFDASCQQEMEGNGGRIEGTVYADLETLKLLAQGGDVNCLGWQVKGWTSHPQGPEGPSPSGLPAGRSFFETVSGAARAENGPGIRWLYFTLKSYLFTVTTRGGVGGVGRTVGKLLHPFEPDPAMKSRGTTLF